MHCVVALMLGAAATVAVGCGTTTASAPALRSINVSSAKVSARVAATGSACTRAGDRRRANATLAAAAHRYRDERSGSVIHADLRRIARDRVLLAALRIGDFGQALAEAKRQLLHHVVRIRVVRGSRVLDANPISFDVAGSALALHAPHGQSLGTLWISIQDVIGFMKLIVRHDGASAVVVRGSRGQLRTSLPAAASRSLPPSGCVTIAGRAYVVRTLHESSFTGEPLTIWILVSA